MPPLLRPPVSLLPAHPPAASLSPAPTRGPACGEPQHPGSPKENQLLRGAVWEASRGFVCEGPPGLSSPEQAGRRRRPSWGERGGSWHPGRRGGRQRGTQGLQVGQTSAGHAARGLAPAPLPLQADSEATAPGTPPGAPRGAAAPTGTADGVRTLRRGARGPNICPETGRPLFLFCGAGPSVRCQLACGDPGLQMNSHAGRLTGRGPRLLRSRGRAAGMFWQRAQGPRSCSDQ